MSDELGQLLSFGMGFLSWLLVSLDIGWARERLMGWWQKRPRGWWP